MRKHLDVIDALDLDMNGFDDRHVCVHQVVVMDPELQPAVFGHLCACAYDDNHRQLSSPAESLAKHREVG